MVTIISNNPPPVRHSTPEADRIEAIVHHLKRQYDVGDRPIYIIKAPLRVCPLGAHIDHQLGHVTGMTIDEAILLAFVPTEERTVTIDSLNFAPPVAFSLDQVPAPVAGEWGNYVRGAAVALQQAYQLQYGLIGVIDGNMPIGGLSSSAAVTIAYLLALETVNHLQIDAKTNIGLVRLTEHKYIKLKNGILDQSVILLSQPNHLTYIDCQTFESSQITTSLRPDDFDILVVYSGVSRTLSGTGYNNRVTECQEAARQLLEFVGSDTASDPRLRHIEPRHFENEGHRLPALLQRRARHYFGEFRRVSEGLNAWQQGDLTRLGDLINESGESSIKYYESGSPQLITLYETLRESPGVFGTRFSGGGFGGCCLALVDPAARESIAEALHRRYPEDHPIEAANYSIHFCRSDGPARLVS